MRRKAKFSEDKRRKHHHWQTTIYYADGEKFARVYTDHEKGQSSPSGSESPPW
jgi:hypothetical protein